MGPPSPIRTGSSPDRGSSLRGPAEEAVPSGLESTAPTRQAVLGILLRDGEKTAADLAQTLDVSVQVMRRHLRSLEVDGLVECSRAAEGPGRPINRWCLTDLGRGHFPDRSDHFALGLLQSMATTLPAETMQLLLNQQAVDKAAEYRRHMGSGPLKQRLDRLVDLRRTEGYLAELQPASSLTIPLESAESAGASRPSHPSMTDGWIISEFHCSVIRIAEEFPMICDQELQLLRHAFPDCTVERIHWRLEQGHSCGFLINPQGHSRRS